MVSYNFILMNKDTKVARLAIDGDNFGNQLVFISEVYSTIPDYIGNINSWIQRRVSPFGRNNINQLLKLCQANSLTDYLRISKGISLTDTFWVKDTVDRVTWQRVSPYRNKLSRIIAEVALNMNYLGGDLRSPSPEYTLDGSTDKCWKRRDGKIYLYKTAGERWGINGIRPYCEYYASQVYEEMGIPDTHYVKYGITVSKVKASGYLKPYVYCPAFTSETYGYLPICSTKYAEIDLIQLSKMLDHESVEILREMLLMDSIILNCDRHTGNYGFLVNNDNYSIKSMNPIFDNDCSLGALDSIQDMTMQQALLMILTKRKPRTELGGYIKQARTVLNNRLASNMRNAYPFKFNRLPEDIDLPDERIRFMEYLVNSQIKSILGKSITIQVK